MGNCYGYCRISTKKQNIERQVRNILRDYPDAIIIKEIYTGTKFQGRQELNKLLKRIKENDTIIIDSVSRMSRDAVEGFEMYKSLYEQNINLVFLKEPHINTDTYKKALMNQVQLTGDKVDYILKGVNEYLMALAEEQIRLAFGQSEKEVQDLKQRTIEGIETARLHGKTIGRPEGSIIVTKKSIESKKKIKEVNYMFGGMLSNLDTIKLLGISRKTFYKYKKELKQEIQ